MKNEILIAKRKTIVINDKVLDVIPFTLESRFKRLCGVESELSDAQYTQRLAIVENIRKTMESKGYRNVTVSMARKKVTGLRSFVAAFP
jgi:hypothetical protein